VVEGWLFLRRGRWECQGGGKGGSEFFEGSQRSPGKRGEKSLEHGKGLDIIIFKGTIERREKKGGSGKGNS